MPLLAALFKTIATGAFGLIVTMFGAVWGVRIAATLAIATIYISCVVFYSRMILPWLSSAFTSSFGMLLGLLFPPVAGSCLAGLFAWYSCIVGKRYLSMLTKMAIK